MGDLKDILSPCASPLPPHGGKFMRRRRHWKLGVPGGNLGLAVHLEIKPGIE